jgi:hypothetical protein
MPLPDASRRPATPIPRNCRKVDRIMRALVAVGAPPAG